MGLIKMTQYCTLNPAVPNYSLLFLVRNVIFKGIT